MLSIFKLHMCLHMWRNWRSVVNKKAAWKDRKGYSLELKYYCLQLSSNRTRLENGIEIQCNQQYT